MNFVVKFVTGVITLSLYSNSFANSNCNNENIKIPHSTPNGSFIINGNGTVTHQSTGLMWMRCSLGQIFQAGSCKNLPARFEWQQALMQSGFAYSGYDDWRVPNKNELSSILELRCGYPAINLDIFHNTPSDSFWSSSQYIGTTYSRDAWIVRFSYGHVTNDYKGGRNYVRLVRSR